MTSQKNTKPVETLEKINSPTSRSSTRKNKKLSYKHQLELDALPAKIEALEQKTQQLQDQVSDPGFFKQDTNASNQVLNELAETEASLSQAYERWDELEGMLA